MLYLNYLKAKKKVCFVYNVHNGEYLVQLRSLIPYIRNKFPNTEFTCACRQVYINYIDESMTVVDLDYIHKNKDNYLFIYEIEYNASDKQHPILKLVTESGIKFNKVKETKPKGNIAYISVLSDFPNEHLTDSQIAKAVSFARSKGFTSEVIHNKISAADVRSIASKAAYVIGAANELFYEAVLNNTPTALIPTGAKAEEVYRFFSDSPKVLPEK